MSLTPPPSAPPAAPDAPGTAPSRANPSTFRALADAFVQWLVGFRDSMAAHRDWLAGYITWAGTHVTEMDALQTDVASKQSTASAAATTATTQAGIATTQAGIATTKAGEASTSATNAATSETNAAANATSAALAGSAKVKETWAILVAITGSAGDSAIIFNDSGTHTDPVTGLSVSNTGIYAWNASPAGWKRIADTEGAKPLNEFGVYITGAPVALGGYIAARSTRLTCTATRFYAEIVGGPCTIQVKVNGVVAHAAIDISGTVTQTASIPIPAGAAVDFYITTGTPTSVWAQVDGA